MALFENKKEKEQCDNCHFYYQETEITGRCRRYPPVLLYGQGGVFQEQPQMRRRKWCGEHKFRR